MKDINVILISVKKGIIYIIVFVLMTLKLFSGENIISFRNIHLKEVMYEWEVVEKHDLGENYDRIYFTKPSFDDSGDLSLGRLKSSLSRFNSSDNYTAVELDEKIVPTLISPHGDYVISVDHKGNLSDSKVFYYNLYNLEGNNIWSFSTEEKLNFTNLNDNGVALFSKSANDKYIFRKDMTQYEMGPFYTENTLNGLSLGNYARMSELSLNGNIAVMASEVRHNFPENYQSFPLGSRVFFYSDIGELLQTYDLEGTELWCPYQFSDNGRFFIMRADPYMYFFKDNKLIIKRDTGSISNICFSEDESLVFINSNSGALIINTDTEKIIESDFKGAEIAIADEGYPIIAGFSVNQLYVANYVTGEIMLYDKFPRYDVNSPTLQISGDGKTVSLFFKNEFRKYKIGDKK